MTITINGTTGIAGVDGSAGTPSVQGADTNTGMFFPAADTIAFAEGGAEVARFNADAQFVAAAGTASLPVITTTGDTNTGIFFPAADTIAFAEGGTEAMRITSNGDVLVGTTSTYNGAKFSVNQPTGGQLAAYLYNTGSSVGTSVLQIAKADNNSTTSQTFVQFLMNSGVTGSGQINANGANAAAFGVYSDSRLKQNIVDLPSQLANIMALRPVEYDYIQSEGGGHQIGFIAQEVETVYPDLVGERADGMLTLTDLNKNDARLIKCIQEQQALITALTARITALEAK
jgi:hypothetical protein